MGPLYRRALLKVISKHPDKEVSHFGPLILQMSSRSEDLLDHIANFLKFISSAQSFWFSDTSYDHGCHLASCFCLDLEEYKALLIVTGLTSYARFGFHIKASAWRQFLGGCWFLFDNCAIVESKQKKIDIDAYNNGTLPSRLK